MMGIAVVATVAIAALYFGRELFIPLALAILLSFVLAPVVRALKYIRIPRIAAVVAVVLVAFVSIFAIGGMIAKQVTELAGDLPRYESTIRQKIQALRGPTATTTALERAADVLKDLGQELNGPPAPPARLTNQDSRPVPVEIRQPTPTALESVVALISPLMQPLTTTAIMAIFVVFILMQREDLRNRFIKLAGTQDLQKTTLALNDAASRLSKYFLIQLALNACFGLVIGFGLWVIGVPSPILWGILSAILRFVPYVGALISAAFPLALAAAVDPGWSMLLEAAALFLVAEPVVGQIIEPVLYGHSTGLSPVAVVASATFWTALWGPIGLVLATPITVCLVVLGRHVERLEFLDVMFGDRPPLSPPELLYQRMLASDPAEAVEKAEEFLKGKPLVSYYDDVALPALQMAQRDVARKALTPQQILAIRTSVDEVVDDLSDQDGSTSETGVVSDAETAAAIEAASSLAPTLPVLTKDDLRPEWQSPTPVLCVSGRTMLDESVAVMLAQLLYGQGLQARVTPAESVSTNNIVRLDANGVVMVCVSYLDTSSPAHMRYIIRRLRRRLPNAKILLCCWGAATGTPFEQSGQTHLPRHCMMPCASAWIRLAFPPMELSRMRRRRRQRRVKVAKLPV